METAKAMKILSINTGSSSLKCALYDMPKEHLLIKSQFAADSSQDLADNGYDFNLKSLISNLKLFLDKLIKKENKVLESIDEIEAIGHRIVHGGDKFSHAVLINEDVMSLIKKFAEFAPLHGRSNIAAVESCRALLSGCRNIAVFDTALYRRIPPKAYLYGLPVEMYEKYGIRRYGFHGINHGFVAREAARLIGKPLKDLKIITCHLGSGSSITAFKDGIAIDTSMGFTPLEGILMGTRTGDLDSGAIIYLLRHLGLNPDLLEQMLNKNSGLKGLCGTYDMRDIISRMEQGDEKARTAFDIFVYRIAKYIGSYVAILEGLDVVVFTGGIGQNCPQVRKEILDSCAKIFIDPEKNQKNEPIFTTKNSFICAMTIPANEELQIARETYQRVKSELK
jgi:acetate kinase